MKVHVACGIAAVFVCSGSALAQWTTETLSEPRWSPAAAGAGNLVLFGGGVEDAVAFTPSAVVDIFDTSTGMWTTTAMSTARMSLAAAGVGTKAIFVGGWDNTVCADVADIYDTVTGTWSATTVSAGRCGLAATTLGTKAYFGGGYGSFDVDVYDEATGMWSYLALSVARGDLAAASVGTKVLFAGGWDGAPSDLVDIYDESTGMWTTANLSQGRYWLSATTVGTKVFFAGGNFTGANCMCLMSDVVDIYDDSTGLWSTATLSEPRQDLDASTAGDHAVFAGGFTGFASTDVADIYDNVTGTWTVSALSTARTGGASTSHGGKAYFGGGGPRSNGQGTTGFSDVVDIYEGTGPFGTDDPACLTLPNSTGFPAVLSLAGTGDAGDLIVANVSSGPPMEFGYTISGPNPGLYIVPPGSAGIICIANPQYRYNSVPLGHVFQFDAGGVAGSVAGPNMGNPPRLPTDGSFAPVPAISAGETRYHQAWFRDGPVSGFSNSVGHTFD